MDNEELEKIMKESTEFVDRLKDKVHEQYFEIERLNNIINEFDKFLFGELQTYGGGGLVQEYYNKLQELKGEDKK